MDFPWSTGRVAQLFAISEPQLADRVRRGKIRPEPPIDAGRRRWWPQHVLAAGQALGKETSELESVLSSKGQVSP